MMDILDYEKTVNSTWWARQIAACDWTGGQHLHQCLRENSFHALYGEKTRLLLLTDGSRLVSFCTYAEKDDIPETELGPWLGFVYTNPDYRGRRLMGKLISRVKELAREDGYERVYIATEEDGLYEKYGAAPLTSMRDRRGGMSRIYTLDTFGFYGWQEALAPARSGDYPGIRTPRELYSALWHVWSAETCAPRMRADWSEENRTLGQCSVTAFLAQDIFGGQVWGVPLGDGNYHCYNVAGGCVFDLTSEQFERPLDYGSSREQLRHDHFMKQEKKERYEKLREGLLAWTRR